jgi:hypothetical protein
MKLWVKLGLTGLALAACYPLYVFWAYAQLPRITITNHSGANLENVVLSGSGFSESLETLAPLHTLARVVHTSGESGLKITFTVGGKVFSSGDLAYLESRGGYAADITVDRDFSVTCRQHFR